MQKEFNSFTIKERLGFPFGMSFKTELFTLKKLKPIPKLCFFLLFQLSSFGSSFHIYHEGSCTNRKLITSFSSNENAPLESSYSIDYQSDVSSYGRGEMHLSAVLNEKDVAVYQTGTWEVDGVEVGDGNPASLEYCVIETLQVVWTHNCEHGVIRGIAVTIDPESREVELTPDLEFVDFGPEQLVARLPVEWIDDDRAKLLVDLPNELQNEC